MGLENLIEPDDSENALAATSGLFDQFEPRSLQEPVSLIEPAGFPLDPPASPFRPDARQAAQQPVSRSGLAQFLMQGLPVALATAFSRNPGQNAVNLLQQRAQFALQRELADRRESLQEREFALRRELQKESVRITGEQQTRQQDRIDQRESFRIALSLAKGGVPFGQAADLVSRSMRGERLTLEEKKQLDEAIQNPATQVKPVDMLRMRKDIMNTAIRETLTQFGSIEDAIRNAQAADKAFLQSVQSQQFKGGDEAVMNLRRLSEAANAGRVGAEGLAGSAVVAPKGAIGPAELERTVNGAIRTLDPRLQKAFEQGGGLHQLLQKAKDGSLEPEEIKSTVDYLSERGFSLDDTLVVQDLLNISFGIRDGKILIDAQSEEDVDALQGEDEEGAGFAQYFRGASEALRLIMDPNSTTSLEDFISQVQGFALGDEAAVERSGSQSQAKAERVRQHQEGVKGFFKSLFGGGKVEASENLVEDSAEDSALNRPQRNNNPGNLTFIGQKGAEMEPGDSARFARFDSPKNGFEALKKDLLAKIKGKTSTRLGPDSTLEDLAHVYAPSSENDTEAWLTKVAATLGVEVDIKLKDLESRVEELAAAVAETEGFFEGSPGRAFKKELGLE